jgi:diguanylate cyclase (GGDEF)-like protein
VLRQVAAALSGAVRTGDLVARIGGEEFCVVTVLETHADLEAFGERMRRAVESQEGPVRVTVSIGGVPVPQAALTAEGAAADELIWSMVDQADVFLYEAKQAGRNAVRVLAA